LDMLLFYSAYLLEAQYILQKYREFFSP
jgi:hypothetical protein